MYLYQKAFQGRRHAEQGMVCQDRCGHCVTPNGWIAAVIADGVSASPMAERGAQIAVESILEYFRDFQYSPYLDAERMQDILCDAFNYALRRVQETKPGEEQVPFSRFTTLQAFLYGEKIGLHWGQAGDGTIFLLDSEGRSGQLAEPLKNGDSNAPVTLQDGPEKWAFGSAGTEGADAILMVTDGLGDALMHPGTEEMIRRAAFRLLLAGKQAPAEQGGMETSEPPAAPADDYYRMLFFGEDDSFSEAPSDTEKALRLFRSVSDDITVLLIQDLTRPILPQDRDALNEAGAPEIETEDRTESEAKPDRNGKKHMEAADRPERSDIWREAERIFSGLKNRLFHR